MTADDEHLRLLSIFHYVVAGITALAFCFPLIHVAFGLALLVAPEIMTDKSGQHPPAWLGGLFAGVGMCFVTFGWTFAALIFVAGRFLSRRKHRTYCLVIAALECLFTPFGTILGVFTIVVLMQDSVKQLFMAHQPFAAR